MENRILLLEDDVSLIDGLQYSLKKNGFDVDFVRSVQETLTYLSEIEKYDMLILDVTLPDGTGFEICEKVRKNGSQIPIIFLTASDEEVSIIRGLDCGGDDYITKPFKLGELCSRIRALLRRAGLSTQGTGAVMECGDIKIDLLGSRVLLKGKILELTAAEYRLICLLVKNANRIITRDIILDELWDSTGDYVDNNTLSVYVRRLREKIETDPSHPEHLLTVRGFGYAELLQILSECEPNIIVITGDLVDAEHTDIDVALDFAKEAVQIADTYYVTGNHEASLSQYDELKAELENTGVVVLEDKAMQLEYNGDDITLIGLSDPSFTLKGDMFGEVPAMVDTKLRGLIGDKDNYTILLSHRPELFEAYVNCGVDLVLSGHAHGGQFRLPFIGGLVAPNQGLFPKYDAGLYTKGDTNMIVCRGLGNSIIPIRFNNRPEIVLLELIAE